MKITIDTTEKTVQISGNFKLSELSEVINKLGVEEYTITIPIPIHDVKPTPIGPALQGNPGLEIASTGTNAPIEAVKMPISSSIVGCYDPKVVVGYSATTN